MLVSRGELIEIGDGFRIPDVLARSGARLVEVGTTNRTRAADYERAANERHGAAPARAPVELPRRRLHRAAVADRSWPPSRAGTTCRCSTTSAPARSSTSPTSRPRAASLAAGADLVCFSGDKLLGGPQAGIVVGRADLVERLRRHPLHRALRIDKLGLAALEGTLLLYLEPGARAARGAGAADAARGPSTPCARAPSGSPRRSAARSRRPSRASAAARCRSPSCRRSPARSRSSSRRRCATTSRRSSGSSATAACCSTAARSPTTRLDEVAAAVRACR